MVFNASRVGPCCSCDTGVDATSAESGRVGLHAASDLLARTSGETPARQASKQPRDPQTRKKSFFLLQFLSSGPHRV